ncbi:membrane protein YoeI [Salmonella enterica]|nr:membrane protein YoeI [Salmonella enterica]
MGQFFAYATAFAVKGE